MRLPSATVFLALPVSSLASSAAVYLRPAPNADARVPALSPYEANSVLANYVGVAHSLFNEVFDDAVDFGKKEWSHLWDAIIPSTSSSSLRPDSSGGKDERTVMLFIQSDHPQGLSALLFLVLQPKIDWERNLSQQIL